MTEAPRVADHRANRAVITQWENVVAAAKAGVLSPAATAFVLAADRGAP